MTRTERIAENKAAKEVLNHIYDIRRQIRKEEAGLSEEEITARKQTSVENYFKEHGLHLNLLRTVQ